MEIRKTTIINRNNGFPEIGETGAIIKGVLINDDQKCIDGRGKLNYIPRDELKSSAKNWDCNGIWTSHKDRGERSILEHVGTVSNYRYDDGGLYADLHFHCATQESKSAYNLIQKGIINAVSVEMGCQVGWCEVQKCEKLSDITYLGLALVERGACEACTIDASIHNKSYKTLNKNIYNIMSDKTTSDTKLRDSEHIKVLKALHAYNAEIIKKGEEEAIADIDDSFDVVDSIIESIIEIVDYVEELEANLESAISELGASPSEDSSTSSPDETVMQSQGKSCGCEHHRSKYFTKSSKYDKETLKGMVVNTVLEEDTIPTDAKILKNKFVRMGKSLILKTRGGK